MDRIKKYLDNLFLGLPETPDVLRAKAELMQMMEDKYEELIKEGKSEEETFGIVVSEFGSLQELAEELGIAEQLQKNDFATNEDAKDSDNKATNNTNNSANQVPAAEIWHKDKTETFMTLMWKRAKFIALGVALIILSSFASDFIDEILTALNAPDTLIEFLSVGIFFGVLAVGIYMCVRAGQIFKKFGYRVKMPVTMDLESAEFVKKGIEEKKDILYRMRLAGLLLIIFFVIPSNLGFDSTVVSTIFEFIAFLMLCGGISLLIISNSINNRFMELSKATIVNHNESPLNSSYFVGYQKTKLSSKGVLAIIISIVLVIAFVACSAVFSLVSYLNFKDNIKWGESSVSTSQKLREVSPEGIDNIDLNIDAADIAFQYGDTKNIKIYYNSSKNQDFDIKVKGSTLEIKSKKNKRSFNINFHGITDFNMPVTIVLPNSCTNLMYNMKLDAGNLTVDEIAGEKLEFNLDAGNANIDHCKFKDIKGKIDAGNAEVSLNDYISNYSLNLDSDMGNITAGDTKKTGIENHVSQIGSKDYSIDLNVDAGNIVVK